MRGAPCRHSISGGTWGETPIGWIRPSAIVVSPNPSFTLPIFWYIATTCYPWDDVMKTRHYRLWDAWTVLEQPAGDSRSSRYREMNISRRIPLLRSWQLTENAPALATFSRSSLKVSWRATRGTGQPKTKAIARARLRRPKPQGQVTNFDSIRDWLYEQFRYPSLLDYGNWWEGCRQSRYVIWTSTVIWLHQTKTRYLRFIMLGKDGSDCSVLANL